MDCFATLAMTKGMAPTSEIDRDALRHPVAVAGGGKPVGVFLVLGLHRVGRRLGRGVVGPVGGLGEGRRTLGGALGHECHVVRVAEKGNPV